MPVRHVKTTPAAGAVSALAVLALAACSAVTTTIPAHENESAAAGSGQRDHEDCGFVSHSIGHAPAVDDPDGAFAAATLVAGVEVEVIDAALFDTETGRVPPGLHPQHNEDLEALEVSMGELEERAESADDDETRAIDATLTAMHQEWETYRQAERAFVPNHLVVLRVDEQLGVLSGSTDVRRIVTLVPGGRAIATEGPHSGCAFEHQFFGPGIVHFDANDRGVVLLYDYSASSWHEWPGLARCRQRAERLTETTGERAICLDAKHFLPLDTDGTWQWHGVLDVQLVDEEQLRAWVGGR